MQFYEDDKFDPPAPDSALSVVGQLLKYFIGVVVVVLIIYAFVTGAPINTKSTTPSTAPKQSDFFSVEYRVYGSANDVDVSYENATGGQENRDQVFLPWSFVFRRQPGEFLYIAAYNRGGRGTLSCEILLDGVVQETQSIIGDGNVQCSGRWKR